MASKIACLIGILLVVSCTSCRMLRHEVDRHVTKIAIRTFEDQVEESIANIIVDRLPEGGSILGILMTLIFGGKYYKEKKNGKRTR